MEIIVRPEPIPVLTSVVALREAWNRKAIRNPMSHCTFVRRGKGDLIVLRGSTAILVLDLRDFASNYFEHLALDMVLQPKEVRLEAAVDIAATLQDSDLSDYVFRRAEMLREYFGVNITDNNRLVALPALFGTVTPPVAAIRGFLIDLCTEVNWAEEQSCIALICTALGTLFAAAIEDADDEALRDTFMPTFCNGYRPTVPIDPVCTIYHSDFTE